MIHRFQNNTIVFFLLAVLHFCSCKKAPTFPGSSSLTIANAVTGTSSLATNFKNSGPVIYAGSKKIAYKKFGYFSAFSGSQRLRLFEYPDTTEKDEPVIDLMLELPVGTINTLFLTGTSTAPDTLFTRDNMPFFTSRDSSMGMRFVNLSPGSQPISVNIKGSANGSETSGLAYKEATSFRNYPINSGLPEYVFEFRDVQSGELIATYTTRGSNYSGSLPAQPNTWRYRSFTLALAGTPDGAGEEAQTVMLINQ